MARCHDVSNFENAIDCPECGCSMCDVVQFPGKCWWGPPRGSAQCAFCGEKFTIIVEDDGEE